MHPLSALASRITYFQRVGISLVTVLFNTTLIPLVFNSSLDLPDADEKFLAYLPHSGFHNQCIALENALTLSYMLIRTLTVPPIHLGSRPISFSVLIPWHSSFPSLGRKACVIVFASLLVSPYRQNALIISIIPIYPGTG